MIDNYLSKALEYADSLKRDFNIIAYKADNTCWHFAYKHHIIHVMFYQKPNKSTFTVFESNFGQKGREIFETNYYDSFKKFLNGL